MSKELIIFPFGGNTKEAVISILAINAIKNKKEWDIKGFIDDERSSWGKDYCGVKVGGRDILSKFPDAWILALPGNPANYLKRKEIISSLNIGPSRFATIVHPSVVISADSKIGYNTLLMPNVVISCDAEVGNHCMILPNTVISHSSIVGDYCCIGANVVVSGNVSIGSECYIGSGVNIKEKISIGKRTMVGLGSNIISSMEEGVVAVGNPARIIRKLV